SYRFTDVHSTVLTSERDTQVSVDFGFEASSAECELPRNITIFFGKKAGLFPNTECMLKHIDGVCIPSMKSEICKCLPNTRYRLSEAIKKDENTRYEFRTQPRYGETLVVNVTAAGEDTSESQSSQHGVDLTVVISVTVAALAATLITFRVVSIRKARKSRVSSDIDTDTQSGPPTETPRQEESGGNEAGPNYPPRVCLDPALSDNYLRPSVSPEVRKGTDDARNVTPFYNNSVLRPVVQLHNTICKPDSDSPLPCRVTKSTSKDTASSSGYIEMSRPAEKRSSDKSQEQREYVNI
ncbi:hypothetical protein BaRGS_00031939, partial [Batillaria attramentaria]